MRRATAIAIAVLVLLAEAATAASRAPDFSSTQLVLEWINRYRHKPDPGSVPTAMRALSRYGAFREPEGAGVHVGFLAGVIGDNPQRAEDIVEKLLPMPPEDHWLVVRAVAYSGLPDWKALLNDFADRMPGRQTMIDKYVGGKLPTLNEVAPVKAPTLLDRLKRSVNPAKESKPSVTWALDVSPEVLDTLWGYYFATGDYGPVLRIVAMLPWSKDRDHVERLTVGSMAKYTLASNASRDPNLLGMLKSAARHQDKDVLPVLKDVIDAAETAEMGRIRKEAMAAIEDLRRMGPGYKREISWWGKAGEAAIGAGCVAAAVTGMVAAGLPCVVGGAVSSAALRFWAGQ
jgi:hypothetical protein